MPVLTLIGCGIFEDSIIHLLENDRTIDNIIVIKNGEHNGITGKIKDTGIKFQTIANEKMKYIPDSSTLFTVVILIQSIEYHTSPKIIKKETYGNIGKFAEYSDAILLFYGLCGGAFKRLTDDFKEHRCHVEIIKDKITPSFSMPIGDCITASMGSTRNYYEIIKEHSNAIFFTPMWASNWRRLFTDCIESNEIQRSDYFRSKGIEKLIKINTGKSYEIDFHDNTSKFADMFDLEVIEVRGSMDLIESSYQKMKISLHITRSITENTCENKTIQCIQT